MADTIIAGKKKKKKLEAARANAANEPDVVDLDSDEEGESTKIDANPSLTREVVLEEEFKKIRDIPRHLEMIQTFHGNATYLNPCFELNFEALFCTLL